MAPMHTPGFEDPGDPRPRVGTAQRRRHSTSGTAQSPLCRAFRRAFRLDVRASCRRNIRRLFSGPAGGTRMKKSLLTLAFGVAVLCVGQIRPIVANPGGVGSARLNLVEATVDQLQKALQTGLITSEQLVGDCTWRASRPTKGRPGLNANRHVNPKALAEARRAGRGAPPGGRAVRCTASRWCSRTTSTPTTCRPLPARGAGRIDPARRCIHTRKLREAGAIIIGKATLTEFANFLANGMPSGYSSLGGYGFNPYDPRAVPGGDGRPVLTPGGSSSGPGIAVAANLAAWRSARKRPARSSARPPRTAGRHQADGRTDQPRRNHSDHRRSGHGRSVDAHGHRRRDLLGALAGFDPNDPATAACLIAGQLLQRLHAVPRQAGAQRRAHRGAAVSREPRHDDERRDRRAAREGAHVRVVSGLAPQLGICVAARPRRTVRPCCSTDTSET